MAVSSAGMDARRISGIDSNACESHCRTDTSIRRHVVERRLMNEEAGIDSDATILDTPIRLSPF